VQRGEHRRREPAPAVEECKNEMMSDRINSAFRAGPNYCGLNPPYAVKKLKQYNKKTHTHQN